VEIDNRNVNVWLCVVLRWPGSGLFIPWTATGGGNPTWPFLWLSYRFCPRMILALRVHW